MQYLSLFNGNIYARSPFASGCLSGKLNLKSKFKKLDYRYDWLKGERLKSILKQAGKKFKKSTYHMVSDSASLDDTWKFRKVSKFQKGKACKTRKSQEKQGKTKKNQEQTEKLPLHFFS